MLIPWVIPTSTIRCATLAERGKFQFLFVPDFPAMKGDIENEAPQITIDPMMTLAAVARGTSRIGLVATGSATFNEPYNLARQFKAMTTKAPPCAPISAYPLNVGSIRGFTSKC
ncbi:hypothetical protein ATY78_03660 [Rhizobium sp. R635]|uniref:LLM class flavin-dependent oxidoreductase n=1 Tax=Rhizobium sp. R635 TaxID=1764275 RepID=UPI000B713E29|nr:LLM class flavin-dependent oxidoreductase [Rhizobium sp. R635]OWV87607.1 hypothetical protein ATY78_03660 [Rhizobium sp. R635]